jgi:hypothetical protein
MTARPPLRKIWLCLGVLSFLAVFATGCQEHLARLRGPGFDEGSKRFTSEIPEREQAGRPHNLSSKAREIEANFGFQ